MHKQLSLLPDLDPAAIAPPGLLYVPDFISKQEESALLQSIEALPFAEIRMHGVIARRTVVHHGWEYGYNAWSLRRTADIPSFLDDLRGRAARLAGVQPDALAEALTSRYPPGAGIGWHRDAPMFGKVAGISLLAPCVMRFRKEAADGGFRAYNLTLEPRSAYLLDGEARGVWQHAIPAVKALRYSISFRTIRA